MAVALAALTVGCGSDGKSSGGQGLAPTDAARTCLVDERFKVQGPLFRERGDEDAPDRTLVAGGGAASAYLGWYDDEARAERSSVDQARGAKEFGGSVERRGKLTIVWVRGRDTPDGDRIRECALS